MAHVIKTTWIVGVFAILTIASVQKIVTDRKLLPGELSPPMIATKASSFLRMIGRNAGDLSDSRVSASPLRDRRDWDVDTNGHEHWIKLDEVGNVVMYAFQARRTEQYRGRGRTGKQFFRNAAQAKSHLRALATKLGVPTNTVLKSFSWKKDGEVADANSAGAVGGSFVDPKGRLVAAMSCDPQDGELVYFTRHRFYKGVYI